MIILPSLARRPKRNLALAFWFVENILALPRPRLTGQTLRPIDRLLQRALASRVLSAAQALVVRTLPARLATRLATTSARRSARALPLDQHLAADGVGQIEPLQGAAIAHRFLRR